MNRSIEFEKSIIEVFQTNVNTKQAAFEISRKLETTFPGCHINFDLEDCDRILRIEAQDFIDTDEIITIGHQLGAAIELLED